MLSSQVASGAKQAPAQQNPEVQPLLLCGPQL
jgi:hypothetical protein